MSTTMVEIIAPAAAGNLQTLKLRGKLRFEPNEDAIAEHQKNGTMLFRKFRTQTEDALGSSKSSRRRGRYRRHNRVFSAESTRHRRATVRAGRHVRTGWGRPAVIFE